MSSLKCPQCNLMNYATAVSCQRCGFAFQEFKRPMPPVRTVENTSRLSSTTGMVASSTSPPPVKPPPNPQGVLTHQNQRQQNTSQISPHHSNPPNNNSNALPNQFSPKNNPVINQTSGVKSSTAERNTAMAEMVLETNSGGVITRILLMPWTITCKIAGFLYNHKKLAALTVAVPAIAVAVGPNLLDAIKSANENSAVATIKVINQAQTTFLATKYRCGGLKELEQSQLVDSSIGSGIKSGYVFTVGSLPGGCEIFAKPTETEGLTATGNRSFYYSSRDNTLRVSTDKNVIAFSASQPFDVSGGAKNEAENRKSH